MRKCILKRPALLAGILLPAAVAAAPAALAEPAVTIFGLLDVGLVRESGGAAGSVAKVSSSISNGSRLGVKGVEDLGHGWSALFMLESGLQLDTGALGQGGVLFGRQSWIGLRGPIGILSVGRQYTSHFDTLLLADPFSSGLAGDAKNVMPSTGDAATRITNGVRFATERYRGFNAELMFAPGEVAGSSKAGRQFGGALGYAAGPLNVRLGYHYRNNDTAGSQAASARNALLAATWNFGAVKAHLGYGVDKGPNSATLRHPGNPYGYAQAPQGSLDSTDLLLGLSATAGRHTFLASWLRKDDRTAPDQDARQTALGYRYALSRRTDTYLTWGHIDNRNGAGYAVGGAIEAGSGNRALGTGIRHQF
ncbi:MAG: porin [Janthinobacterium lividum]